MMLASKLVCWVEVWLGEGGGDHTEWRRRRRRKLPRNHLNGRAEKKGKGGRLVKGGGNNYR